MTELKKFFRAKSVPAVSLVTGLLLTMGVTVFATSIGTDMSVTGDVTVTSGARVGTGSTAGNITALADDSLFVEGQSEFDGIAWFDGSLRASSTLLVTGAATFYGNATLIDATTTTFAVSNYASTSGLTVSASSTLNRAGLSGAFFSTSNATSAMAAGINVTSGCFAINGACVGTVAAIIGGSNTQIQYNNSGLFGGASNFVYQNSRVGIGTTTPGALLSLGAGDFILSGANIIYASSSTSTIPTGSANAFAYATSSADVPFLRFDTTNYRLGLGTTSPATTFTVAGSGHIYATGGLGVGRATTTSGNLEISGSALFGDAAADLALFNAATIVYNNAGTTSIPSANAAAWAIGTSTADVPFLRFDTSNYRIGVGTTTPTATLTVGGAGNLYAIGGLGVGIATTTAGGLEITGNALFGDAAADVAAFNAATIRYVNAGTTTIPSANAAGWAMATSSADVPFLRFDTSNYRIGVGTTSPGRTFSVSGDVAVSQNLRVGANGTAVAGIIHGFCDFGAIDQQTTIAASSTGAVACTHQAPTGLSAGDKVWLTASSSAIGILPGTFIYTGMASSTASNRIQALIFNTSGTTLTIPTTTWQYLIIK